MPSTAAEGLQRQAKDDSEETQREANIMSTQPATSHAQQSSCDATLSEVEKQKQRLQAWRSKRKQQQEKKQDLQKPAQTGQNRSFSFDTDEDDDTETAAQEPAIQQDQANAADDGAKDPLDAFMEEAVHPAAQQGYEQAREAEAGMRPIRSDGLSNFLPNDADDASGFGVDMHDEDTTTASAVADATSVTGSLAGDENEHAAQTYEESDSAFLQRIMGEKRQKAEKLGSVDHYSIEYEPFRKNFYIEAPEIASMSSSEVKRLRHELDGIRVRGKNPPKPIKAWTQAGLSNKLLDVLHKLEYGPPMAIQAQAIPAIMSGRDCICVAKTGSGKTLAYVLPMLRHVKDQRPLARGEGPIALVIAPTRELVVQISKECKKFAKPINLATVSVYGGGGVSSQIGDLKRGGEIVVCTPGRMIDVLTQSGGRVTNLFRVTYLVLDEADRMFDFGFEPQISRIIQNTRPDRQTVMFSATFPRSMELLARAVLKNPVEILVGGRSTVNPDIEQSVEIRSQQDRFLRLLEILGEWFEWGKILIFVHTQDTCDQLFQSLLQSGYPCLSLHGGKEQADRESTISDFKSDVCNVLVATSIAARGLDVPDLRLVINYDAPSHREDYVHRVGRTGRAGNKGTAVTFVGPEEYAAASDVCKALRDSKQPIPEDLHRMEKQHNKMMDEGSATKRSGYGGSGFTFSDSHSNRRKKKKQQRKEEARQLGLEVEDDEDDDEEEDDDNGNDEKEHDESKTDEGQMHSRATPPANVGDITSTHTERKTEKRSAREDELERLSQREQREQNGNADGQSKAQEEDEEGQRAEPRSKQARVDDHHQWHQHRQPYQHPQPDATSHQQPHQMGQSSQYQHDDPDATAEEARQRALRAGASKEKAEQAARAIRMMTEQQKLPNPKTQLRQQQQQQQLQLQQQYMNANHQGGTQVPQSEAIQVQTQQQVSQPQPQQPSHISAMQAAAASAVQKAGGQAGASHAMGSSGAAAGSAIAGITSMTPEERAQMITDAMQMSEQQQKQDAQALQAHQQQMQSQQAHMSLQQQQELLQQQAYRYQQQANQRQLLQQQQQQQQHMYARDREVQSTDHPCAEMVINDLPQSARWKVTHKEASREVAELTGCAVTVRGVYVQPGKEPPAGERKLYIVIEGPSQRAVQAARAKLKEIAEQAAAKDDPRLPGGVHAAAGSHKSLLK